MVDLGDVPRDKWVCPNDRQLALRAKLKTGWSVKTGQLNTYKKPSKLDDDEQEIITSVIKRAETLDMKEQERIGRLVEKLENMKKHTMGNGTNQCILCGDEFGIMGASSLICSDCKKAVCTKCGVDTLSIHKEPLWLCKICSETREMWKKSGAWFFKGIPKYVLPEKKQNDKKGITNANGKSFKGNRSIRGRDFNTWSKDRKGQDTSDHETETSSDEDLHVKGARRKKKGSSVDSTESLNTSSRSNPLTSPSHSGHPSESSRIHFSASSHHDSVSAADATYGDESRGELSDSERSMGSEG